jgi:EmrB/QacA subfamily drug resistance transporter
VLAICCTSLLLVSLDSTVVNAALPAIHRGLHASLSELQWTLDAYTLVLAALLMLGGSTGDRLGRRRVFQVGLAVFTTASALCAVAPSLEFLVGARVLQAIGGSMMNPVAMSIIRNVFVDPRERAHAIGMWGAVTGIGTALGPIVGGLLVDGPGWRYVFLVNVPIGVLAVVLTVMFIPESRAPHPRRFDPVGQLLVISGLGTLVFGIIEGGRLGWGSPAIVACFVVAPASFVALIVYELRRSEPLVEVRFFRSVPFAGASAIAVCAFAATGGFLLLGTLYLQSVRGYSALHAGLFSLPMAVMTMVLSPVAGRIVATHGSRWPLALAGIFTMIPGLLLVGLDIHTSIWVIIAAYSVFGAGAGLVNPPITNTAVAGMPAAQAGVAAAIASTSRMVGVALGVAVIGAVTGAGATGQFGNAFALATHPGWVIIAVLGFVIFVLGILTSTRWALETARRTATRFALD